MRMNADGTPYVTWNKGLKLPSPSEETRGKLREKRKGRKPTLGMKFGEETRRKHSEAAKRLGLIPPSHKGVVRSPEVRKRMSDAQRRLGYMQSAKGANAPNWKGGIALKNRKVRDSTATRNWRNAVLNRDGRICQHCYKPGGRLQAHHIKEFAIYPDLRFEISNGLTLCKPCHLKHHFGTNGILTAQTPAT